MAELSPELQAIMEPIPNNFRMIAQIYTDQSSLIRRTVLAVEAVLPQAGGSALFDFSADPLKELYLDDTVIEIHTRIVDLLIMAALGQKIEISEFQDYAKALVPLYGSFEFVAKIKNSALKNSTLAALEQEWLSGSDFARVQALFKIATNAVNQAAIYCTIGIDELPEF